MSELEERIGRFEKMAQADPDNDMAHFSLGNALLQAGRFAEAAASLQRCLELNPDMSKAYQLAGEAMIKAGWTDRAVEALNTGHEIAAAKGDLMPKKAIAELLSSVGKEPPALPAQIEAQARLLLIGSFGKRQSLLEMSDRIGDAIQIQRTNAHGVKGGELARGPAEGDPKLPDGVLQKSHFLVGDSQVVVSLDVAFAQLLLHRSEPH